MEEKLELQEFTLKLKEKEILGLILEKWPTSALEIAEHFKEDLSSREQRKKISTKYSYYLQKLADKKLVLSKRVGNALIVWPPHVEKHRSTQPAASQQPKIPSE